MTQVLEMPVLEAGTAPLTQADKDLLLHLETLCVEHEGRLNLLKISKTDGKTLGDWKADGFINYGRIRATDINNDGALWVTLSEEAWAAAQAERRAKAARQWAKRTWRTTDELRREGAR